MSKIFPNLRTERLLLRQFIPKDIEQVFEGLSNPEVVKYYGVSYHSLSETEDQMKWFKSLEAEGTGMWWAINALDDHQFYGALGFNNLSTAHRKAELGFWLLPSYWGKGIMREAINGVCEYGFEKIKLHRIEAMVESENENSKRSLENTGFNHEGQMQDCEIKNGKFISLDVYAKLH